MKKEQKTAPPAAPQGRVIRLHRQQFEILHARMQAAGFARHRLELIAGVAAMHQGAQADLASAQQAVQKFFEGIGLGPDGQYQIDPQARTVTILPPQKPPAPAKEKR